MIIERLHVKHHKKNKEQTKGFEFQNADVKVTALQKLWMRPKWVTSARSEAGRRPFFETVLRQTGPLLRGLTDKVTSLIKEAYVSKAAHLLEDWVTLL